MSDDKAAARPESDESAFENTAESAATQAAPNGSENAENLQTKAEGQFSDAAGSTADDVEAALADQSEESAGESPAEDDVASLQAELETARSKADENMDLALRTRAEMENLRKRQSRELENAHKYALDKIAEELIPVRDTLELGVAAAGEEEADLGKVVEGTELTLKMLTQALEKFNILEVDPMGEKFNPDLHQAISMQEGTDQPANTVLTVMQKGYTLNDRLLRPAMVVIAK